MSPFMLERLERPNLFHEGRMIKTRPDLNQNWTEWVHLCSSVLSGQTCFTKVGWSKLDQVLNRMSPFMLERLERPNLFHEGRMIKISRNAEIMQFGPKNKSLSTLQKQWKICFFFAKYTFCGNDSTKVLCWIWDIFSKNYTNCSLITAETFFLQKK